MYHSACISWSQQPALTVQCIKVARLSNSLIMSWRYPYSSDNDCIFNQARPTMQLEVAKRQALEMVQFKPEIANDTLN